MNAGQSEFDDAERELVHAQGSTAEALAKMAMLEQQMGLKGDAAEDMKFAAQLQQRANVHAQHVVEDMEHQDDEPAVPNPNGRKGSRVNPKNWSQSS